MTREAAKAVEGIINRILDFVILMRSSVLSEKGHRLHPGLLYSYGVFLLKAGTRPLSLLHLQLSSDTTQRMTVPPKG